jgi:hypothetical protein
MKSPKRIPLILFVLFIIIACLVSGRYFNQPKSGPAEPQSSDVVLQHPSAIGQRTKTSGCVAQGPLPDKACTPGAIFSDKSFMQICTPGYSKTVRNVPTQLKREVYREYGITHWDPGEHEVDHLIPLSIGGSNDIANLWPEPADPRPGFHEKDKVENYLHKQVCSGKMTLQDAQKKIADNWLEVYRPKLAQR